MATKKKLLEAAAGAAGSAALNVEDVFSTYLWDGAGGTQTIVNGVDLTEGGLVWAKQRSSTIKHVLSDSERGTTKVLSSNSTAAESTETNGFTSFNSDGFTFGSWAGLNNNGDTYASWTFRKAPKFFDVVTYTGTGVARTVSHNLGSVPAMIIVKRTDSATSWNVYHRGLNGGTNPHQYGINLNTTGAEFASSGYWNNTAPTSTEFTVGTSGNANASGGAYVAYLFAHNDGDGDFGPTGDQDIIKCGSYTGNGSTTGPVIDLGFEPQWILVKGASSGAAYDWRIHDVMRGFTADGNGAKLEPNTSDAEDTAECRFKPLPTGFQPTSNAAVVNGSGQTYIYIAIRRGPMAVPESATDVFAIDTWGGGEPAFTSNFPVDMSIFKGTGGSNSINTARLIQGKGLYADTTGAEVGVSYAEFDYMDGWNSDTTTNSTFYSWMWKRAPNYFDVVAYTGDGVAGRTVSHNLGVAPEMMWVKRRDSVAGWVVYHSGLNVDGDNLPETDYIVLQSTAAAFDLNTAWNDTAPSSNSFTVGTYAGTNPSGGNMIAYLFASVDGVSKVGSYTGNGTTQNIDCGFSSGARFVLIKSSTLATNWYVFDTERGIVAGNDAELYLDSNAAETTTRDLIDPYSAGFTMTGNGVTNTSGQTYIFYAIA